jgi:membrane fusion protein, heavy metal efflux system
MRVWDHLARVGRKHPIATAAVMSAAFGITLGAGTTWYRSGFSLPQATAAEANPPEPLASPSRSTDSIDLTDSQMGSVKIETAGRRKFSIEKEAVGSIDFNEDLSVQVFAPYQGKIVGLYAKAGDRVTKGQTLYTIESPDLIQAESNLIAAAGVLDLTARALNRARQLFALQGIAQKDLEQAVSDQQSAEGALRAARDAVRVFGKTDAEIDRYVTTRRIDPLLVVPSPIDGEITARNAAPGLLVQPGNPPAPYSVADNTTMWMLAYVTESDSPSFRLGQPVKVSVMAFPGHLYSGKITTIGATVDPNTHRVMTRSEIQDPNHELRPGMIANFVIETGGPVMAAAVPVNAIVREGDGTMTAWVTTDRRHFVRHTVKVGLIQDGYDQIIEGLQPGELVVTDGAIFLSNAVAGGES